MKWRPKPRQMWAALLALTMLATSYVLLDKDLGTPAPLFQEFTCRGRLSVSALNGFGAAELVIPQTAVTARAVSPSNESRPVYLVLWTREGDEPWRQRFDEIASTGTNAFFLDRVTNETQAYVTAADMEGKVCRSESGVLRAVS